MNSLFGGFGNMFMNMARGQMAAPKVAQAASTAAAQPQMPNILMQAMGAALRGEDPHTFMQNLAAQHPQLKQYDLSNLSQTAQQVCQQNGVDMQSAINQIDNITSSITSQSP